MANSLDLSERVSVSKRNIGRSVSVNGVHAVDVDLKKAENLSDPIVDLNIKLNNPIGRLWLALKRLWKSQNTIIALKFTIPLIVLPIAIYVGYRLWQGRGVSIPMSKLGLVHEVIINGIKKDILVLPTSDVYLLGYSSSFNSTHRLTEKPVIIIGTYNNLRNELTVEDVVAYNALDIPRVETTPASSNNVWDTILNFINQFR